MLPDGTPNLYAFVRASGSVFWTVRLMVEGKRTNLSIGKWPDIKADEARRITPSIKSAIAAGYGLTTIKNALAVSLDPVVFNGLLTGERVSASEATPTFQVVARRWYEDHLRDGLSEGPYKRQVIQQLEDHVFPRLGERPINEIRRKEIVEALRMLWIEKRPTAQKVRGNIERIFDYAIDLEFREDNPTPPPRSMPVAQHQVRHFASMPYERAGELWTWLHDRPRMGIQTRVRLRLALLLGKRTGEIRHMEWTEIDFAHGIWSTPADKMKKRKAHRQPLSSQALQMPTVIARAMLDSEIGDATEAAEKVENQVLKLIWEGMTIRDMAEEVFADGQRGISKSRVGRVVKTLTENKWIQRVGRNMVITNEGIQVLKQAGEGGHE